MGRLLSAVLLPGLFVSVFIATATEVDKTDYTIIAYRLSEEQENSFNHTNGEASSFWTAWDDPGNESRLDYIHLLPETHGTHVSGADCGGLPETCPPQWEPGFSDGPDDAQFKVRMAGGEKGVYTRRRSMTILSGWSRSTKSRRCTSITTGRNIG
jgi:hypothetical protein